MVKNFPILEKDRSLQIEEAQQILNRINPKKSMPRHIIVNLLKTETKTKILKERK